MKRLSIVLFLAISLISCDDKKETTKATIASDLELDNLKGDIRTISEIPFKTDSTGKIGDQDTCCISVTTYDSLGFYSTYVTNDSKGAPDFEQAITRFENKLFKELKNTAKGKVTTRIEVALDKEGKKYVSATEYDSSGKPAGYFKDFTQNEFNQLTSMTQLNPDSSVKSIMNSTYSKSTFVGQTTKDSSGKVTATTKIKLDDKGNQMEVVNTSTVTDPETNKDSTTTTTITYKYDAYDDKGNWTQRTEFNDKGKAVKIVKREITFYKK